MLVVLYIYYTKITYRFYIQMVRLVFIYKTRGKYSNALYIVVYSMLNMLMSIEIKVLI